MRATYNKLTNVIIVELLAEEVAQYFESDSVNSNRNLRRTNRTYEYTIPCTLAFYNKTQKRKGGAQDWNQEQLRAAVRSQIAHKLVPFPGDVTREAFGAYQARYHQVIKSLLRNIRLVFPNSQNRTKLTYDERQFRSRWRSQHGIK